MRRLILVFFIAATTQAQQPAQQGRSAVCVTANALQPPTADALPNGLNCSDNLLKHYYAARTEADFARLRRCAYAGVADAARQGITDDAPEGGWLQGPAVLAMLYANGEGIAPNLRLAEHFACGIHGGWDDGTDLAQAIEAERLRGHNRYPLDICKTPTGLQINVNCLNMKEEKVAAEIAVEQKRFEAGQSPTVDDAFRRLLAARKAYRDIYGAQFSGGTSGNGQGIMEQAIDEDKSWVQTLKDLEAGKTPQYNNADLRRADANLNRLYQQRLGDETPGPGGVQIRKPERVWLKYRDAWVVYGTLRWPQTSPESWLAWLAVQRGEFYASRYW
jgi:uncharacterized protein YecT (DUF1311 family)